MNNNFKLQVIIFLIIFLNNRQKLMCNFIILIKKRFLFYKLFNLLVIINHFFLFLICFIEVDVLCVMLLILSGTNGH